jgi:hypothetical protein
VIHLKIALTSMNAAGLIFAQSTPIAITETEVMTVSAYLATKEMVMTVTAHHLNLNLNTKRQHLTLDNQLVATALKMLVAVKAFACADKDSLETVMIAE